MNQNTLSSEDRRDRSLRMELMVSLRSDKPAALSARIHNQAVKANGPMNIRKSPASSSSSSLTSSSDESCVLDRHELLPDELLALARSPMVKGKGADIPDEWSITGNLAVVSRARELVADVVLHGNELHRKW